MKRSKGNSETINKPARKISSFNSGAIIQIDEDRAEEQEQFDKNMLSEADMDRIQALI